MASEQPATWWFNGEKQSKHTCRSKFQLANRKGAICRNDRVWKTVAIIYNGINCIELFTPDKRSIDFTGIKIEDSFLRNLKRLNAALTSDRSKERESMFG